jgi:hypothetical protein
VILKIITSCVSSGWENVALPCYSMCHSFSLHVVDMTPSLNHCHFLLIWGWCCWYQCSNAWNMIMAVCMLYFCSLCLHYCLMICKLRPGQQAALCYRCIWLLVCMLRVNMFTCGLLTIYLSINMCCVFFYFIIICLVIIIIVVFLYYVLNFVRISHYCLVSKISLLSYRSLVFSSITRLLVITSKQSRDAM